MLNGISLFTGIGGIDIALSEWVRPICYCEIDPYCQAVILNRQFDGLLPRAPIWDDVSTLCIRGNGRNIDIIYGGFPCQDISVAGHGKGLEGERSGLVFEIFRLARDIRPSFIFLENVPAITTRGGVALVQEITALGYDCRWCVISAAAVGALHKRERWFLLAHSTSKSADGHTFRAKEAHSLLGIGNNDGNTYSQPSEQTNSRTKSESSEERTRGRYTGQCWPFGTVEHWKKTVSEMGKCSDGLPFHVDRLRALGNAVVPCQAKEAFKILMGLK